MLSFPVGRTRVSVHPLVLVAIAAAMASGYGPEAALLGVALLTHEAAHLLVAGAYELQVDELEILPFGGRARIVGLDLADPGVEAVVALAGPVNNLLLYVVAETILPRTVFDPGLTSSFAALNLSLALFNLVPGLPLDGGRVLRALLTPRLGRRPASDAAALAGRVTAVVLFIVGAAAVAAGYLVPGVFLLAWLVWARARPEAWEAAFAGVRRRLRAGADFRRRGVLQVRALAVHPDVPLGRVMRHLAPGRFHVVWVAGDDLAVLARLDVHDLEEAIARLGPSEPVGRLLGP